MAMRVPIYYGRVEKGKIKLDNPQRFHSLIRSFEGKRVELVLREKRTTHSDAQRAYYHSVVVDMLAEHIGDEHDAVHEDLKVKFNNGKSTKTLKTMEFENYLERIRRWADVFHGLNIPLPNQVDWGEG